MKVIRTGLKPEQIKTNVKELGNWTVKVGWFPSAVYPDGTPVAGVMAVQEFGSKDGRIPPRAPMRITQANKQTEWKNTVAGLSARVLAGKMDSGQLADALGMTVAADIQRTIAKGLQPALSESTLYARRHRSQSNNSEKPLVDTRVAFNTLTYTKERK